MRWTSCVVSLVLLAVGVSSTQAGLFDVNLLERFGLKRTTADVEDCGPGAKPREVVKAPCNRSLHTYQRQVARPLPAGGDQCAKPIKPIAECTTEAEKAAALEQAAALQIARLIFQSQTGCYARDRRAAVHALGDDYDCSQNPEILVAFVYALNDADESVRAKAADEIGDQIHAHPACRAPEIVAALKVALSDCDPAVRREVKQALTACGVDVVKGSDGDCAKPEAKCVPAKKTSYDKSAPADDARLDSSVTAQLQAVSAEKPQESQEGAASEKGVLPGLINYLKRIRRPEPDSSELSELLPTR